jgi:hypothetical protein
MHPAAARGAQYGGAATPGRTGGAPRIWSRLASYQGIRLSSDALDALVEWFRRLPASAAA